MAILTQNESSPMFYSGWYGTEPELDIDECVSFPLISGTKDSSVRIYDEIQAVYLVSGNGQGTLAYDGTQTIPTLISFSQIKELKCGKCYRIILKPGSGSVDIPEFTFANNGTEDEYRLKFNTANQDTEFADISIETPTPTQCTIIEPIIPNCDEVSLSIQSDTEVNRSVTLRWYVLLPNHTIPNHRNGTLRHNQTFNITEDVTKVDQWFMYSNSWKTGFNSGNWTVSSEPYGVNPNKANLTYNDTGETIVVDLTNRKLTLARGGAGHNLTFNFDVPYGKELPSIEDISINAHDITKHGDVKHSSTETILGASSLYFDGNGDYLSVGDTSTFKFLHDKTTDFTIEGWVYANSVSPYTTLFTTNGETSAYVGCSAIIYPDGGIYFETYRGVNGTRGIHYGGGNKTLFKFSAWNHVVITFSKSEDKVEIYVNGLEIEGGAGHGANPPSLGNSNIPLTIGHYRTNSNYLNGYLQDFRISKKVIYTGCFVPPVSLHANLVTTPNEPSCGEVALNIQSDTAQSVTLTYNVLVPNHPVHSELANGTYESTKNLVIYGNTTKVDFHMYNSSTSNISQWQINNPTITYEDGTSVSINLRDRKQITGTTEDDKLLFTFDIPYPNNTNAITDISVNAHVISKHGNPTHSTTQPILGNSSLYFDGNDSISIPNSKDVFKFLHSGIGVDFTVESWIKITQANQYQTIICTASNSGNTGFMLVVHNMKPSVLIGKSETGNFRLGFGSNTLLNLNTWHHVAVVNINGKIKLFVDGKLTDESEFTDTIINSSSHDVSIGCEDDHTKQSYFVGQLQDLRISKKAVYTGCFVPPASLHANLVTTPTEPSCGEVALNIQSNTTNNTDAIEDISVNAHVISKHGNPTHSTTQPILGNSSLYFDGDDYLSVGDTSTFNYIHNLTSEYTIECWVYINAITKDSLNRRSINITGNNGPSQTKGFGIYFGLTGLQFWTSNGDGTSGQGVTYVEHPMTDAEILNNWMHIAVAYDKTETKLFLNGTLVVSSDIVYATPVGANATYPLTIGYTPHDVGVTNYPINAYIQDFRISQKAVYTECFVLPNTLSSKDCLPTPTPTCTPKISWQVNDAYGNWINRNYDASLYLEETEPGKFCTKNSDGFVYASLCIGPKTNPKATSTWGLTSDDIRNFTYTDCYGNVTTATDIELTRRTGTCANEPNSWWVWFKACFDTNN